jgi:hypothetical protein
MALAAGGSTRARYSVHPLDHLLFSVQMSLYTPKPKGQPSKHFTWAEVIGKSGYPAVPIGPFKLPNGKWCRPRVNARTHAGNLERFRDALNAARAKKGLSPTGIFINSWARSWQHNVAVGGAKDSQHLYFLATDITKEEVARICPWSGGGADFDRIASEVFKDGGFGQYPGGARHVDSRGYRARWSSYVGW